LQYARLRSTFQLVFNPNSSPLFFFFSDATRGNENEFHVVSGKIEWLEGSKNTKKKEGEKKNDADKTLSSLLPKKRVKMRDGTCLDYDKCKTQLIQLTAKTKDQAKLWEVQNENKIHISHFSFQTNSSSLDPKKKTQIEQKFEEQKELYKKINGEVLVECRDLLRGKYTDVKSQMKLYVKDYRQLFEDVAKHLSHHNSFSVSAEKIPVV
jgi:hypothetical protein